MILLTAQVVAPPPPQWLLESPSTQVGHPQWLKDQNCSQTQGTEEQNAAMRARFENSCNTDVYLDQHCLDWVKTHISPHARFVRRDLMPQSENKKKAHVDCTRNYTIIYIIRPGGDNAENVWYKDVSSDDLLHPKYYRVQEHRNLEPILKTRFAHGAWHLINGRVIHDVENRESERETLQIGFEDIDPDLVLTKTRWFYPHATSI